jgi:hypothetical protein
VCGNPACTDLGGGRSATTVPTALPIEIFRFRPLADFRVVYAGRPATTVLAFRPPAVRPGRVYGPFPEFLLHEGEVVAGDLMHVLGANQRHGHPHVAGEKLQQM